jgi:hypothetical protein
LDKARIKVNFWTKNCRFLLEIVQDTCLSAGTPLLLKRKSKLPIVTGGNRMYNRQKGGLSNAVS